MKRYGNLWPKVCCIENIKLAAHKSLSGKKMTKQRVEFLKNKDKYIEEIHKSLIGESYKFGELYSFTIREPKVREIHCPKFYPDRILHHCLMNVIAPLMLEKFTNDTYGSIPKMGITLLVNRLKKSLSKNPNSYYLKVDIKKFYQSIDIGIMKSVIRRVIKCNKTINMIDSILDIHDKGIPIGAYTSQYFGNLMLSGVDHWVKEVVKVKHYYRYMDDMLFIVNDKQEAHRLFAQVKEEMDKLNLTIKNNAVIAPISTGIDFVGYKFYPTHTRLRKSIKDRMKRRVGRLHKQNVSDRYFMKMTASHYGWCKHADSKNLIRSVFKDRLHLYEEVISSIN